MFEFLVDSAPWLARGLGNTLLITCGGCLLALLMSLVAGLGRNSHDVIVRFFTIGYIELFRGTSALVQLYWFYFALPLILGIRLHAITVGILVLGLNIGAYGAEVVRSAIEAVPREQQEAAIALNMSSWQRMRFVILPQAIIMMLPPFGNLMIELLKSTSLVSMITLTDLTRAGLFLRDETHRTIEIFGVLLVIYFALSLVITAIVRWLERRFSHSRQQSGGQ